MPQALRKFSNDDVRRVFSQASSVDETKAAGAVQELERHMSHWPVLSTGLISAVKEFAATTERNIAAGSATDVDRFIGDLQQYETEENAARAWIERMSFASVSNPDLLSALNKALALYLDLSRSVSQGYHDARWRLMEARSRFMPSAPTGPVHGEITDLDALIKS
jgi:hypothetical protein